MAKLSILLDRVHDEFSSVPEQVALRALSDSAKEFCTRTHAWQGVLPDTTLRIGETVYELSTDTGVQIAALKEVRINGVKLPPIATEVMRLRTTALSQGLPMGYVQWHPSQIELVNAPSQTGVLRAVAALTLALNAVDVNLPDDLIGEYGEALAAGAKGRLVRQSNQPWYAPDAVLGYVGPYYMAVAEAKGRVISALGEAEMQVELRRW